MSRPINLSDETPDALDEDEIKTFSGSAGNRFGRRQRRRPDEEDEALFDGFEEVEEVDDLTEMLNDV